MSDGAYCHYCRKAKCECGKLNKGVVSCSPSDSIRIVGADGLAVQIPAAYVLAVDRVLKSCVEKRRGLVIGATEATLGWARGYGDGPWGALVALAQSLEADNAIHAASGI